MRIVRKLLVGTLMSLLAVSSSAFADERHVVDSATLAATVGQQAAQRDADRAAVHEALARPEVREVAAKLGLDLERATAAVDTLSGTDLDRAAAAARQVNQSLVGGASTIVISTTTIILVLLVVILLVVLLK